MPAWHRDLKRPISQHKIQSHIIAYQVFGGSCLATWISSLEYQILPSPVGTHIVALGHLSKGWLVGVSPLQGMHCKQGYDIKPRLIRLILSKLWCMNNICMHSAIVLLQDVMPPMSSNDICPGTRHTQYYQSWQPGHETTYNSPAEYCRPQKWVSK
jgi:hypothetical protein